MSTNEVMIQRLSFLEEKLSTLRKERIQICQKAAISDGVDSNRLEQINQEYDPLFREANKLRGCVKDDDVCQVDPLFKAQKKSDLRLRGKMF